MDSYLGAALGGETMVEPRAGNIRFSVIRLEPITGRARPKHMIYPIWFVGRSGYEKKELAQTR